jgi:hypothetical protein
MSYRVKENITLLIILFVSIIIIVFPDSDIDKSQVKKCQLFSNIIYNITDSDSITYDKNKRCFVKLGDKSVLIYKE